jgi:POT family proton-dependent oligopeptide transporter
MVIALWRSQARRQREPSTVLKMAYGCLGGSAAYLILSFAALDIQAGDKASWLWLLAYFVVLTVSELYISPTSLSLVTKVAPARALSTMMGVWLLTYTGGFLAGWLGGLWSGMSKSTFFLLCAAIAAAAGLATLAFARPRAAGSRSGFVDLLK